VLSHQGYSDSQEAQAGCLQVYLNTNQFREWEPQYANSKTVTLPNPTSSTLEVIHHATEALRQLYRPGFSCQKVGVVLVDLVASSHHEQQHLFRVPHKEQEELMAALIWTHPISHGGFCGLRSQP
jgi:DNA polymerase V